MDYFLVVWWFLVVLVVLVRVSNGLFFGGLVVLGGFGGFGGLGHFLPLPLHLRLLHLANSAAPIVPVSDNSPPGVSWPVSPRYRWMWTSSGPTSPSTRRMQQGRRARAGKG